MEYVKADSAYTVLLMAMSAIPSCPIGNDLLNSTCPKLQKGCPGQSGSGQLRALCSMAEKDPPPLPWAT